MRLHKYTKLLLEFTYEQLLNLTDEDLEKKNVTLGARGKILKEIALVKERPHKIREMKSQVEEMGKKNDLSKLEKLLPELEKIILMPLKPYPLLSQQQHGHLLFYHQQLQQQKSKRHDSGSDSGTELCGSLEEKQRSWVKAENIPLEVFEVLKKICSLILISDGSCSYNVIVTMYVCLLERCLGREAFNHQQKQSFHAWIHRLRTVWNPPTIRKATDYKRK